MNRTNWNINTNDLLHISGNVWIYWKDCKGVYLGCNDRMAEDLGFTSRKEVEGRSDCDFNLPKGEVQIYRTIDSQVMQSGVSKQVCDTATLSHAKINFIVFKTPIYDSKNKIVGVLGFSHYTNERKLGTLNAKLAIIDGVYLSRRYVQVLQLLIRGKTIKQIGKSLKLSPRTIESYLENIKTKFNVSSKCELIEKVIDKFLQYM